MNLLMISGDRSIPEGRKGAFWYMLQDFSAYWDRIDVICPRPQKIVPGDWESKGLFEKVFFHPSPRGLWYQVWWIAKKGAELVRTHRHAVMSVHEYAPFYNGIGAEWLSRRVHIPYVLEVHHIVGYPRPSSLHEWGGRWLSRLFIINDTYGADAVRCVSRYAADLLRKWGACSDDVYIVPSFHLDRAELTPDPSIEKKYDLVCCGRLVANKGLFAVLKAVSLLPDVTLLIIGDGPLRRALEARAKTLGIYDRVYFAGWLPENKDVYRAIQSARVFVTNSLSEGGPRVALEAMALGMPVITTPVGVMPEVIHEGAARNGYLTTWRTADLAEIIEKLLAYPSMQERLGHEARKILNRFERYDLIKRYALFLQSIAHLSSTAAQ